MNALMPHLSLVGLVERNAQTAAQLIAQTTRRSALALFALAALGASNAFAAGLQVAPVSVALAQAERAATRQQHEREHRALLVSEYGAERVRREPVRVRVTNPHRQAAQARTRAAATHAEADELRSLPVGEAARRIEAKRAEQEQTRQRAAERARQLRDPFERDPHHRDPRRDGRGLGR